MVSQSRPYRPVLDHLILDLPLIAIFFVLCGGICFANPETLKVEFLPLAKTACAVVSPDQTLIVSVFVGSSEITKTNWITPDQSEELINAGQDKITRLCFFQNPRPRLGQINIWKNRFGDNAPSELRAISSTKSIDCRFEKWINQVGDKVLPLGLLSVAFYEAIPPAGTPLIDENGKIVGLILQPASPNSAYAIPTEAVHRVLGDILRHRKLVRGWLGISLSTESQIPRITRVWANSPAARAGIEEQDILLKAGPYFTDRYPDAVNALFYTIPGEVTAIEILRDSKRLPFKITPVIQKPGAQ
ncbi:MAG: serine protease [Armatimonadetes bacterium]|nr:serine protease [Akkermansiaceae bacterium]